MLVLEPRLAILDETDSGLDIDALKIVADGVNTLRSPERSLVLVTHYQRLLDYIVPDHVHVLVKRAHRAQRRQVSGARARAARLRLGDRRGGMNVRRTLQARSGRVRRGSRVAACRRREPASGGAKRSRRWPRAGCPMTRDENWRYTNLRPLERARFGPVATAMAALPQPSDPTCRAGCRASPGMRSWTELLRRASVGRGALFIGRAGRAYGA